MLNLHADVVTTWPSLGPPPRVARVGRRARLVGTLVLVGMIALATIVWLGNNSSLDQLRQVVDAGQEIQGEFIDRSAGRGGSGPYLVTARYRANGRLYIKVFESKAAFDQATRQRAVVVSYAVDDPSLARLGTRAALTRELERGLSLRWLLPLVLLAPAAFFTTVHWLLVRTHLSLARDGILRWGTVTDSRTSSKTAVVTVSVDDGLGTAERTLIASFEFAHHQPIGSKAAVLSDPADLSRFHLCEEVMASVVVDPADAT